MRPGPTLLQATGDDAPTALYVVLLLIALGIGYLLTRAAADKITGAFDEEATYELFRRPDGALALAPAGSTPGGDPVAFDEEQMRALVERVHGRNEMRLHFVVEASGDEVPFEHHDAEAEPAPTAIVFQDSQGRVRVGRSGLVEAKPPLDDAVRGDLLEVLESVLEAEDV